MSLKPVTTPMPSISDYIDAVANPHGRFRSLGEIEAQTDARAEVRFFAGNNAALFPVMAGGRKLALKCYIKHGARLAEIYGSVCGTEDKILTPARFLPQEVYVFDTVGHGAYYDVTAAEWVEGITLEIAIRRAAREGAEPAFRTLSQSFDHLARQLLSREWAHGDMKPENIIVRPDGSMCLIDYDAMFIPSLAGEGTSEIGTPNYQHPARDGRLYDKSIDDYPIALIGTSLRALALDASLYARYNRLDNIILYPDEILGGTSAAYAEVLELFAAHDDPSSYGLALTLQSPTPHIDNIREAMAAATAGQTDGTESHRIVIPDSAAVAMEPFEQRGRWGYCDELSRILLPAVYEQASSFSEGLAVVRMHGALRVIDRDGRTVIDCGEYDNVKPFSEGMAAVSKQGRWGYMDIAGRIVVGPQYELAGAMRDGRALVRKDGKYGYIDRCGTMVIDAVYDYATGFMDGKATVCADGNTYCIAPDGTYAGE